MLATNAGNSGRDGGHHDLAGFLAGGRPRFLSHTTMIDHFYKCFGCGKRHSTNTDAIGCCAVAQEIWECRGCGAQFGSEMRANAHLARVDAEIAHAIETIDTQGQSFAAGFNNFSTP